MTIWHNWAREIMGPNLFDAQCARHATGEEIPEDDIQTLPFNERTLTMTRSDHLLVLVPSFSVLDLRKKFPDLFHRSGASWYDEERWAASRTPPFWDLVRIAGTPSKTEPLCHARTLLYTMIAYHKRDGGRLFDSKYVRSREGAYIGRFDRGGIHVEVRDDMPPRVVRREPRQKKAA